MRAAGALPDHLLAHLTRAGDEDVAGTGTPELPDAYVSRARDHLRVPRRFAAVLGRREIDYPIQQSFATCQPNRSLAVDGHDRVCERLLGRRYLEGFRELFGPVRTLRQAVRAAGPHGDEGVAMVGA